LIRETAAGVELDVRVIPRARRSEVAGIRGDDLVVRLAAPPVEGAANDALVDLLSRKLDLPHRSIQIVTGLRSRRKRVLISGMRAATVARALDVPLPQT
jgi:uncharacterized protein